ncbi:MAG: MMPL family transporter, partial [Vicinamibacteria bacterium]
VNFAGWANNLRITVNLVNEGQFNTFWLGLVSVFIATAASFRSLRAGACALAPVLFSMLATYGVMGFLGVTIGISTAIISSVAFGVGVDYGIHYYAKYGTVSAENPDPRSRAVETMRTSGRAIFINALVVSSGFLVLLFSNFVFSRHLGILVCVSMMTCFIAAVSLIPIMLARWRSKQRQLR